MNDVIFTHKLRLLDVDTRLRLTGSLGLGCKRHMDTPFAGNGCSGLLLTVRAYKATVGMLNFRDMFAHNVSAYTET